MPVTDLSAGNSRSSAICSFDQAIPRRASRSAKWDRQDQLLDPRGELDLLHFSVADMDFALPPEIQAYYQKLLNQGVLGYAALEPDFARSVAAWQARRHGIELDEDWLVFAPRIKTAMQILVEFLTEVGDSCLEHVPLYPPLQQALRGQGRLVLESRLREDETGRWRFDLAEMEALLRPDTRLIVFCNPHNPTGRVWSREELEQLGDFALHHKLWLIVDEIHADILREGQRHQSLLGYRPELDGRLIIVSSLNKAFGVTGVPLAWLVIPNADLRARVQERLALLGLSEPSSLAAGLAPVAYGRCAAWLDQMLAYVDDNEDWLRQTFARRFPELRICRREGSFTLWIDARKLGLSDEALHRFLLREARINLYAGSHFGPSGAGFLRWTIACPRSLLEEALRRLERAWPQRVSYLTE